MERTMFGWSRPWKTRIPLHTLSSFPFTFFGMAFSPTSGVTFTAFVVVVVAAWVREGSEVAEEDLEKGGVEELAVRRSTMFYCSGGTCHVAHCHNAVI
jgi:hypothetical protein